MKLGCYIVFALLLQSSAPVKPGCFKDHSMYFEKGKYREFFNDQLASLREVQLEYPGVKWTFTLFQLKSESKEIASKRIEFARKKFTEARLDMDRITFNSQPVLVKDFGDRVSPETSIPIGSVGAVLEGIVSSLE